MKIYMVSLFHRATIMNLSNVKWAQWDRTQSRELLGLFICVCIALCTIVAHNIAQNRPDNFPSYPPDTGWLGSPVVRALDSRLDGCEFDSDTGCQVTTLDKFVHSHITLHCISVVAHLTAAWENQVQISAQAVNVYHNSHYDIQPTARAAHRYCSA